MKPILVGSKALEFYQSNLSNNIQVHLKERMNKSKDIDLMFIDSKSYDSFLSSNPYELKQNYNVHSDTIVDKFSTRHIVYKDKAQESYIECYIPLKEDCTTSRLFDFVSDMKETEDFYVANVDMLYTIKMSHRFLKNSPHFYKTMWDILFMRSAFTASIFDQDWYQQRMKETYDYSSYKLNVKSKDFFTSNFDYIYDHDSIHRAVAVLDMPAYEFYIKPGSEVFCSKEMFFNSPKSIRILGVLEETYVLALERSQIPSGFKVDPKVSFMMALEKVCTSITSGWFREYAWENFHIVERLYEENYVQNFHNGLKNGIVKKFEG